MLTFAQNSNLLLYETYLVTYKHTASTAGNIYIYSFT